MTGRKRRRPPKSIFPRTVRPLPQIEQPGAAIKRLIAERRDRVHAAAAKAEFRRIRELKAAFAEGARFGRDWADPDDSWWASRAQRRLNPPVRPGQAARRWQHELKLRAGSFYDEAYADRWHRRCRQLRAAFEQGHYAGACGYDLSEAWQHSPVRRDLYPGPPTPLHRRILSLSRGEGLDRSRDPGGPGQR